MATVRFNSQQLFEQYCHAERQLPFAVVCAHCGSDEIQRVIRVQHAQNIDVVGIDANGLPEYEVTTEEESEAEVQPDGKGEWYCCSCGEQDDDLIVVVADGVLTHRPTEA